MNHNIQALDALLNISEEAKQSIYTYGMASVSNLISESLSEKINCLDSNNNYYYLSNCLEQSIINLAYSRRFAEMKYSENMLAIPLWIRKYIYDYTSTVDTDNGEMDLLAYRNILYIEDNFTKGDLAI